MTRDPSIYHLKNIRHYYGQQKILDIYDLDISTGSITGLMGPNGSGKSTLLKILAFALKPTEGQIFYKGREESGFSPEVRLKVTLLTQKPYLLKRTVFENIIYGLTDGQPLLLKAPSQSEENAIIRKKNIRIESLELLKQT